MNLQGLLDFSQVAQARTTPMEGSESDLPTEDGAFDLVWSGEKAPAALSVRGADGEPASRPEFSDLKALLLLVQAGDAGEEPVSAPQDGVVTEAAADAEPSRPHPPAEPAEPETKADAQGELGVVVPQQLQDPKQPAPRESNAPAPPLGGERAEKPTPTREPGQQQPLPADDRVAASTAGGPAPAPEHAGDGAAARPAAPQAAAAPGPADIPRPAANDTPVRKDIARRTEPAAAPTVAPPPLPNTPAAGPVSDPARSKPASPAPTLRPDQPAAAPQPAGQPIAQKAPAERPSPALAPDTPASQPLTAAATDDRFSMNTDAPQTFKLGDGSAVQLRELPQAATPQPTAAPHQAAPPPAAADNASEERSLRFAPPPLQGWPKVEAAKSDGEIPAYLVAQMQGGEKASAVAPAFDPPLAEVADGADLETEPPADETETRPEPTAPRETAKAQSVEDPGPADRLPLDPPQASAPHRAPPDRDEAASEQKSEDETPEADPLRPREAATNPTDAPVKLDPQTASPASEVRGGAEASPEPAAPQRDPSVSADLSAKAPVRMDPTPPQAAQISHQIASAVHGHREGNVEISLSPEELGKVRMTLHTHEAGLRVVVQAERAETLDLMRRHIDSLERDFREIGYADVSFSFGDHPQQKSETAEFTSEPSGEDLAPTAAAPRLAEPARAVQTGSGGLDLRI